MRTRALAASSILLPVAALATALPASAAPAPAAMPAASSTAIRKAPAAGLKCSGTVLTRKTAYLNGKSVGVLTIYIRNTNSGTAIACFQHAGLTKNKRSATSVTIYGANTRNAKKPTASSTLAVNTSNLAGVVALNHVKVLNHCFQAAGSVRVGTKTVTVRTSGYCYVRVR